VSIVEVGEVAGEDWYPDFEFELREKEGNTPPTQ